YAPEILNEDEVRNKRDQDVIDLDSKHGKETPNDEQDAKSNKKNDGMRYWEWDHFTFVKGETQVPCPYCKKVLAARTKMNGTSTLIQHLKNVCKKSPVYKKVNLKNQATLSFKPINLGETSKGLASHSFSQAKCRKSLAQMCIIDSRPFSVVDDQGFVEFIWDLNPLFKIPSRWTIARDCLSIYKEEAHKLKSLLKNQTVSLTTDTWTSVQKFNFMCLTTHWVDDNWTLRKKILNFFQILNHKGVTIGKLVYRCLHAWGIDQVFTVTVDNASSNDGEINFLVTMLKGPNSILNCKYLHLRCCAHIINLVVKEGLEEQ
ncbi:zinc finger BED domain-containing protein RICESLEEPER 2-like protein, partial [Tanacetum coccineum]